MSKADGRLAGRVCVITGSAAGVGRAASLLFAHEGATVVGVDIDAARGAQTAKLVADSGGAGSFFEADVADPHAVRALAAYCRDAYGRTDVLFNNAGKVVRDYVSSFSLADWNRVMAVNVNGPLLCAEAFSAALEESGRGSIVNHSSIDGIFGNPHVASLSVSKAALNSLTRLMAHTYGNRGIRANSICSGNLANLDNDTSSGGSGIGALNISESSLFARMVKGHPALTPGGRVGTVEQAASVALFLASDESAYVNGAEILLTGGRGVMTPGTTLPSDLPETGVTGI